VHDQSAERADGSAQLDGRNPFADWRHDQHVENVQGIAVFSEKSQHPPAEDSARDLGRFRRHTQNQKRSKEKRKYSKTNCSNDLILGLKVVDAEIDDCNHDGTKKRDDFGHSAQRRQSSSVPRNHGNQSPHRQRIDPAGCQQVRVIHVESAHLKSEPHGQSADDKPSTNPAQPPAADKIDNCWPEEIKMLFDRQTPEVCELLENPAALEGGEKITSIKPKPRLVLDRIGNAFGRIPIQVWCDQIKQGQYGVIERKNSERPSA